MVACFCSDAQHRTDANRQLGPPVGRAVSGCPGQPPSTLILLAGAAAPSMSSASAATDTASVNQQSGRQAVLGNEALHWHRLDKACEVVLQRILAICARSTQHCQLELLLTLHDQAPWLLPANGGRNTACTKCAVQSDEAHIGSLESVGPSTPLKGCK